ncbi:MAG TPA: hypothetical protein VGF55_11795 [Gemmataceae bacterium]|jgi:hypothetical protein
MTRVLPLAVVLALAPAARGQLIAYDGFDYPIGGLRGQGGGMGFARPWDGYDTVQVQAASLTPPAPSASLATTGNSVSAFEGVTFGAAARTLSQPVDATPGTTFWLSAVVRGPAPNPNSAEGLLILQTSLGPNTGISVTTGTSPSSFWTLQDPASGAMGVASSAAPSSIQCLLVVRGTFAAVGDTYDLYVNPPLTGTPPPSPAASITASHATAPLDQLALAHLALPSDTVSSTLFDEVRIGHTFADVTPVPEPSARSLAGVAGAAVALARRRRR